MKLFQSVCRIGETQRQNVLLHVHSSRPLLSLSGPDSVETLKQFHCVNGLYIHSLVQCSHSVTHSLTLIHHYVCLVIHLIHQSACMPFIITHLFFFFGGAPLKISTVVPLSICMDLCVCELCRLLYCQNCVHVKLSSGM